MDSRFRGNDNNYCLNEMKIELLVKDLQQATHEQSPTRFAVSRHGQPASARDSGSDPRAPRLQHQFRDRTFFDAVWRELTKQGERKVFFDNLVHDFPNRIIYGMEADGAMILGGTSQHFQEVLKADIARIGKIAKEANIKIN